MSQLPSPLPKMRQSALPVRRLFRRLARLALDALAFGLTAVAVTGFIISLGRREIARDLMLLYFQEHGIEAEVEIDQLSVAGLSGTLRLGPAKQPTAQIDRFEVVFARDPGADHSGTDYKIESISLIRPRLWIPLKDGQFDLGRLDPVIKILSPPSGDQQTGSEAPNVFIDGALVTVQTGNGPIIIRFNGVITSGQQLRLDGRVIPFNLAGVGLLMTSTGGPVQLRTGLDRIHLIADLGVTELINDSLGLEDARLRVDAFVPFRNKGAKSAVQAVEVTAGLKSGSINSGAWVAQGSELNLKFDGTLQSQRSRRQFFGTLAAFGRMEALSSDGVDGRAAQFVVQGQDIRLTASNGVNLTGTMRGQLGFDKLVVGRAYLDMPKIQFRLANLSLAQANEGLSAKLGADIGVSADRLVRGGIGLNQFSADAQMPNLAFTSQAGGEWTQSPWKVHVSAAKARLATGGETRSAVLGLVGLTARFSGTGRWGVGGLGFAGMVSANARDDMDTNTVRALIGGLTSKPGAPLAAQSLDLEAGLSDFQLTAPKTAIVLQDGAVRASLVQPIALISPSGMRLELAGPSSGATFIQDQDHNIALKAKLSGELGEGGRDLKTSLVGEMQVLADGTYRLGGQFEAPYLNLQNQQVTLKALGGQIELTGDTKGPATTDLSLTAGQIVDLADHSRFEPLSLKGQASLGQGVWRAKLSANTRNGHALGKISMRQVAASGQGEAVIEAKDLVFANPGLQPRDISPMIRALSQASGRAEFTGRFDWTKSASSSNGALSVTLDSAQTPIGALRKGHLDIKFASLAPLLTGPGQKIGAERLGLDPPLSQLNGLFSIGPEAIQLQVGAANWAGGRVWLEPSRLPLDGSKPLSGNLVLDGVDLGQVLAASPLADQVKITATMDGTLPFEITNGVIRIGGGHMAARGPGRISISRTALTSLQAGTGQGTASATSGPATPLGGNAIQDFAYQAMENLAFDSLDAKIDSRPGARLGLVFHIKGRNDPEKDLPAKIALADLVRGRALDKPIPLPKGTPIDLTLDTSLNFDDLVRAAQHSFERRTQDETETTRRSAPVQP